MEWMTAGHYPLTTDIARLADKLDAERQSRGQDHEQYRRSTPMLIPLSKGNGSFPNLRTVSDKKTREALCGE